MAMNDYKNLSRQQYLSIKQVPEGHVAAYGSRFEKSDGMCEPFQHYALNFVETGK